MEHDDVFSKLVGVHQGSKFGEMEFSRQQRNELDAELAGVRAAADGLTPFQRAMQGWNAATDA